MPEPTPQPKALREEVRVIRFYSEGKLYRIDADGVPIWGQMRAPLPMKVVLNVLRRLFPPQK